MGKLLHYAVDATTIWHLTRELTSQQHKNGEVEIAKAILKLMPEATNFSFDLPVPKSLYQSVVRVCEATVNLQLDEVKGAQAAGLLTANLPLCKEMIKRCTGFALACELYVWKYIEKA